LTIGYFASLASREFYMTASYVYHTSNLLWIIPPGRVNTSLEKLLKPFKFKAWMWFLITLCVIYIVTGILQFYPKTVQNFVFGREVKSPSLNIINVMLGGSLHRLPSRNFSRTILMIFMIYCFIIQNSYKGGLFKFMQMTVREKEVSTAREMIDKNFSFYMLKSSRAFLDSVPEVLKRTVFVTPKEFGEALYKTTNPQFKGALLSSEDHLAYRNIEASPNIFFRHAPEAIVTYNLVIYMQKQSCLMNQINDVVINLVNGGLIQNWASRFIDKSFLKHPSSSKAVGLNMNQLLGAFQLLVFGLFLSFVVFIFEVLAERIIKVLKFIKMILSFIGIL
jgi:hypothetical protein